jgi:ribosomal protein S18 acetylase RimI-like enzyme
MSDVDVRPATADDEAAWRPLWHDYCAFYETTVAEDATAATWRRVLDPGEPMELLVAERDGEVVGFVTYVLHPTTWSAEQSCYLEDLFVSPDVRGGGVGRALIEAVLERGRSAGWDKVYWHTKEDNARARALYDSFTNADGFVRYVVPTR